MFAHLVWKDYPASSSSGISIKYVQGTCFERLEDSKVKERVIVSQCHSVTVERLLKYGLRSTRTCKVLLPITFTAVLIINWRTRIKYFQGIP